MDYNKDNNYCFAVWQGINKPHEKSLLSLEKYFYFNNTWQVMLHCFNFFKNNLQYNHII